MDATRSGLNDCWGTVVPVAEPAELHRCTDCRTPDLHPDDAQCVPCYAARLRAEQEAERGGGSCLAGIRDWDLPDWVGAAGWVLLFLVVWLVVCWYSQSSYPLPWEVVG